MRRGLRIVGWTAVFLACASVGAWIAAHSNPFPPGVPDPGVTSPLPSTPAPPVLQSWVGTLTSNSSHVLYVGGTCTTRWRGTFRFTVDQHGRVQGSGVEVLAAPRVCTFPNVQIQARSIQVAVSGHRRDGSLVLRFLDGTRSPTGAADYGGFAPTLRRLTVRVPATTGGSKTVSFRVLDDEGRGTWIAVDRVQVRCAQACP